MNCSFISECILFALFHRALSHLPGFDALSFMSRGFAPVNMMNSFLTDASNGAVRESLHEPFLMNPNDVERFIVLQYLMSFGLTRIILFVPRRYERVLWRDVMLCIAIMFVSLFCLRILLILSALMLPIR